LHLTAAVAFGAAFFPLAHRGDFRIFLRRGRRVVTET
jgi:hypothetical protein